MCSLFGLFCFGRVGVLFDRFSNSNNKVHQDRNVTGRVVLKRKMGHTYKAGCGINLGWTWSMFAPVTSQKCWWTVYIFLIYLTYHLFKYYFPFVFSYFKCRVIVKSAKSWIFSTKNWVLVIIFYFFDFSRWDEGQ